MVRALPWILTLAALAVLVRPAHADGGPQLRDGDRWFIPVDVGVGPAVHLLPGSLADTLEGGLSLGLYAAIHPDIVKEKLRTTRIPPKYASFAKAFDTGREVQMRVAPLTYLPSHLIFSPPVRDIGKTTSAYGIAWDAILLRLGLRLAGTTESPVSLTVGAGLPTLSYLYVASDRLLRGSAHVFGVGVQGDAALTLRFSYAFSMSLEWRSNLQWTNSYEVIGTPGQPLGDQLVVVTGEEGSERLWHHGMAMLLVHFRVPTYQRL